MPFPAMNRPVTALGRCLSLVALGLGGSVAGLYAKSADLSPAARHEQAWLAQPELDRVTEGVELDVQFLATAVAYESNRRRVEAGKRRLAHEPRAAEAAERHAAMLANLGHISHSSPLRGEETAAARLERTGQADAGRGQEQEVGRGGHVHGIGVGHVDHAAAFEELAQLVDLFADGGDDGARRRVRELGLLPFLEGIALAKLGGHHAELLLHAPEFPLRDLQQLVGRVRQPLVE